MFHVFFEYFGYMDNLKRVMESIVVVEYGDRHGGTCKIPMGRKLSRITYNGKRLTYYQVAFLIKHGYIPEETSHLCHRGKCIEERHLCDESGALNKSRNSCKKHLAKLAKQWMKQRVKVKNSCTIVWENCEHDSECFFKMGRI